MMLLGRLPFTSCLVARAQSDSALDGFSIFRCLDKGRRNCIKTSSSIYIESRPSFAFNLSTVHLLFVVSVLLGQTESWPVSNKNDQ